MTSGAYSSSDNGSTWINRGLAAPDWVHSSRAMEVTKAGEILAAKDQGSYGVEVFRNGTWTLIGQGTTPYGQTNSLLADRTGGAIYLANGTAGVAGKVFASKDSGASWQDASTGYIGTVGIGKLKADPTTGALVALAMDGTVWATAPGVMSTAPAKLAKLIVSPATVTSYAGGQVQLVVTGQDQYGKDFPLDNVSVSVSWDTTFCSISPVDLVTFSGKIGTTAINVYAPGAPLAVCSVTLTAPPLQGQYDSLLAQYNALKKQLGDLVAAIRNLLLPFP